MKYSVIGKTSRIATSVGITHETKQSETTQNIIDKGPVCRQHADLGLYSLWIAKNRTVSLRLNLTS